MSRLPAAILILLFTALPAVAASLADGWTLQRKGTETDYSYSVWARPVAGSSYPEYRMEVALRASVDEVIGALESNMLDPRTWPKSFERKVLRRERGFLLSYDYISVPLLSDRDVVLRTQIVREPESGAFRMEWENTELAGPPPQSGVVRIPRSDGFWRVESDGEGGSHAVYQTFVELTGHMPASLVRANMEPTILQQAQWLSRTVGERRLARRD